MKWALKTGHSRDFPGGPAVKTLRFQCRGCGFGELIISMKLKNLKKRLGTQMLVLILVFSFLLFLFLFLGELIFLEVKVKLSKTVTNSKLLAF